MLAPRAVRPTPEVLPVPHLAFRIIVDRFLDRLEQGIAALPASAGKQFFRATAEMSRLIEGGQQPRIFGVGVVPG